MKLLSVIVPVYNVKDYLKTCLDSIVMQKFRNFELILVDDGSTDGSGDICKEYVDKDERVKLIQQSNGGASKARNSGLKAARGEYIYFIDSDDFLNSKELFNEISEIINDSSQNKPDIIKIKQVAFNDGSNDFYEVYKYKDIRIIDGMNGINSMLKLCKTNQMVVSVYSYFIKRKMLIENNIFFIEGIYSEDINWIPRVFMNAERVTSLDKSFYSRRQNRPGQVTYQANIKRDIDCAEVLNDWFMKKNDLFELNENRDSIYFWGYLSNIYISLVGNQYLYKGHDAKVRIEELSEYSYISDYTQDSRYKKLNYLKGIFGFKLYTLLISRLKLFYRTVG